MLDYSLPIQKHRPIISLVMLCRTVCYPFVSVLEAIMAIARTDVFYQSGILENKIQCDYHLLSNPLYGTVVTRWIAAVLVHFLYTICATQISTPRAILKIKVVKTITRKKAKAGSKSTKIRYRIQSAGCTIT